MAAQRMPVALLIGALGVGAAACSMPNRPMTSAAAEASERMDSGEILQVLHTINDGEIKQAQLALQKSDDPQVQATARMIIKDHSISNQRITALTDTTGANLKPSPLNQDIQAQASKIEDELTELSGAEFDRTYLQKQVELHEVALDTVRTELLPSAQDPRVRRLLSETTPKLERHQQEAEESYASISQRPRG